MAKEEYIRNFKGVILGIIKTDSNGDQTAIDFSSRQILGFYRAKYNHTTDFLGRVVSKGNTVVSFIYSNAEKYR